MRYAEDQSEEISKTALITPHDACAYLEANNWTLIGSYHDDTGHVYRRQDQAARQSAFVPKTAEYVDYPVRILQLAQMLSHVEKRRAILILEDMAAMNAVAVGRDLVVRG